MTRGSTDSTEGVHSSDDVDGGTPAGAQHRAQVPSGANNDAFDVLFGGETEEWPTQASKKGFRAPWPVTVLVALLLLVGGLSLGAFLQRGQSTPSTSTSAAGRPFGAAFAGASKTGAAVTTGASGVTTGTVTDIIGNTLYVTSASGALVAVKVTSVTTVDRNAASSLSALKPGDTVTVQGPTQKNGSVQAASIADTAKGVTTVGGGFGGGGFGGGGGAAASTTGGSSASAGG